MKTGKKISFVASIILIVIALALLGLSVLLFTAFHDVLAEGEAAAAVFGGLFLVIFFIIAAVASAVIAIISLLTSVPNLREENRRVRASAWVFFSLGIADVVALVLLFCFL